MHLYRYISFAHLVLFLLEVCIFKITLQTKNNRILEPCFEKDKNLGGICSSSDDSCDRNERAGALQLVRLPGIRVSEIFAFSLQDQILAHRNLHDVIKQSLFLSQLMYLQWCVTVEIAK